MPEPDLRDAAGRIRRTILALALSIAGGTIAYVAAVHLATPDALPGGYDGGTQARAYKFVYFVTALAGVACFAIGNRIARARRSRS